MSSLKIFLFLLLLGGFVYSNGFHNKFLIDDYAILSNPFFSDRNFLSIWNPLQSSAAYYRPFQDSVLMVCFFLFKGESYKYHLFNFFIFILSSLLIYLFVRKISYRQDLAFLSTVFYIVHPINNIVVNYITAGIFSFQLIFILGAMILFWESLDRANHRLFYVLSLLCFLMALFCHETAVMTPFYIAIAVALLRKDDLKKKIIRVAPYFLMLVVYLIFRMNFISLNDVVLQKIAGLKMNGMEYAATVFKLLAWYIGKLFYPQGIVLEWAIPVVRENLLIALLQGGLLFIGLIVLFYKNRQSGIGQMALGWFLIGFLPLGFAAFARPLDGAMIEPHWFVFSSIGFFIFIAYYSLIMINRWKKRIGGLLLGVLVLVWGSLSYGYNSLWADQKTYAAYWSSQTPHLKSIHVYLGDAYEREGNLTKARTHYQQALSGNSNDMEIYNNLGLMATRERDWKTAEFNYYKALDIRPNGVTYNNLGVLYLKQGQQEKAQEYFVQARKYHILELTLNK